MPVGFNVTERIQCIEWVEGENRAEDEEEDEKQEDEDEDGGDDEAGKFPSEVGNEMEIRFVFCFTILMFGGAFG